MNMVRGFRLYTTAVMLIGILYSVVFHFLWRHPDPPWGLKASMRFVWCSGSTFLLCFCVKTDFYEAKRRVVWMPRKSGE